MTIVLFDSSGDALRCVDFGQIVLYTAPQTQFFRIRNDSECSIKVKLRILNPKHFPLEVRVDKDELILDSTHDAQLSLQIFPNMIDEKAEQSGRTSFYPCQAKLEIYWENMIIEEEGLNEQCPSETLAVPFQASICSSVLFIEKPHTEFESCFIGNTYSQDIQIWNRSECDLHFKVEIKSSLPSVSAHGNVFTLFNCDSQLTIPQNATNIVNGFSSTRIRVTFQANTIGCFEDSFIFSNLFNPKNIVMVNCYSGIASEAKDIPNPIGLEVENGVYLYPGQLIALDDCFYGQIIRKRMWIKNFTDDAIFLIDLLSENSSEVSFEIGKHLPDENIKQIARDKVSKLTEQQSGKLNDELKMDDKSKSDANLSLVSVSKGIESHEEVETLSSWYNVVGNISCDPKSLGLWEHMNNDDEEYSDSRYLLNFETKVGTSEPMFSRGSEEMSFIDQWRRTMLIASSRDDISIKPKGRLAITLIYKPTLRLNQSSPTISNADTPIDLGALKKAKLIFSIHWKEMSSGRGRSNSEMSGRHMQWWRASNSAYTPKVNRNLFSAKASCCQSLISASPTHLNLGECLIGEYYTADCTIVNHSDLPALIFPHVNSESLGIIQKEVTIPPREQKTIQIDYVARLVNYEYSRGAVLYNVYNPDCSPQIEVKAKNIDPNQILSHSIFYKIFTRNKRRQLQIYYEKAFYNVPNVRVFSIKNIFQHPLQIVLSSTDKYEISLYTFGSNSLVASQKQGKLEEQLEELKWGEGGPIMNRRTLSYPSQVLARRSTSSLDLRADDGALHKVEVKTEESACIISPKKLKVEDCIALFEKPGFPFDNSLIANTSDFAKDEKFEPTLYRIRQVQKCFKDFKESLSDPDLLVPVDEMECVLAVGAVYDFLVVYEPRSHGERDELEQRLVTKFIELTLTSVTTATVAEHLERLGHKPSAVVAKEPLKSRLISIQAKVCRSEMMVSQKNVNFGRTTVGEQTSWTISITNLSAVVPLMYSISKSGSISSGFLAFSSPRQGQIPPSGTYQIEIFFRPTLSGAFEEELKIQNLLNPQNSQCIIMKAKVVKAESFTLHVEHPLDSLSMDSAVDTSETTDNSEPCHLGEVVVGEYSSVISFKIQNITTKSRQFIVDASHGDAVSLHPSYANIYKLDVEELLSVCSISCNFEEVSGDNFLRKNRIPEDEREKLEDKLERYNQKLKIGIRKSREDKIQKYKKKIDDITAYLAGTSESLEKERDSDDEKEAPLKEAKGSASSESAVIVENAGIVEKSPSVPVDFTALDTELLSRARSEELVPSSFDAPEKVEPLSTGSSTVAYHFVVPAMSEVLIRIKVTFLPGVSYFPWSGLLQFKGYFRVFECKNEDIVKLVPFDAFLYSSKQTILSELRSSEDVCVDVPLDAFASPSPSASLSSPRRSKQPTSEAVAAAVEPCLFLASVAQWSSYPTKQLYPRYRSLPQQMLGMAIKFTSIRTHQNNRTLQGAFSVSSTCAEGGSLRIFCTPDFNAKTTIADHLPYDPAEHGEILFALAPNFEHEYNDAKDFFPELSNFLITGSSRKILVQWQPSSHIKQLMIVGSVTIEFRTASGIFSTQYIPFVGLLEHKSIIKVEKYMNLGSMPVGTNKSAMFTIINKSETESLHYLTMVVSVAQSKSAVGKITMSASRTGVILPSSSKVVDFVFSAVAIGKFEQQLWVGNLNDRFDQKRMTIKANVVVAESELVIFPQLDFDIEGKSLPINLGLIQVSSNSLIQSPDFVYKLKMINISSRILILTAVSNLKKQCFVFADAECKTNAILSPFSPNSTNYLYIVIRPSSLVSTSAAPSSSSELINSSSKDTSRELVGGIRLLFASSDPSVEAGSNVMKTMYTDEEIEEYNKNFKLFERSIVFKASIGSSVLKLSCNTSFLSADDSSVCYLEGAIFLENTSTKFPLHYSYSGMNHAIGTSRSIENYISTLSTLLRDKLDFVLLDDPEGDLYPGQIKEVPYYFISSRSTGLFLQHIAVMNVSTGVESSIEVKAFFRDKAITASLQREPSAASIIEPCRDNPMMYSHIWLSYTGDSLFTCKSPDEEGGGSYLMRFSLENRSDYPLTLLPVSNMPLLVALCSIDKGIVANILGTGEASKPANLDTFGLLPCGDVLTVPPSQSIILGVFSIEGEIPKSALLSDLTQILLGNTCHMPVHIALISVQKEREDIVGGSADLTILPDVVEYIKLSADFVLPVVKAASKLINLGGIKSNTATEFAVILENCTDVTIPVLVSNMHEWFRLVDNADEYGRTIDTQYSLDSEMEDISNTVDDSEVFELVETEFPTPLAASHLASSESFISSLAPVTPFVSSSEPIYLVPRSSHPIELCMYVPRCSEAVAFAHSLKVVSLVGHTELDVRITGEIEATEVILFCASTSTEVNIYKDDTGEKYCLLPDVLIPSDIDSHVCNIGLLNVSKHSVRVSSSLEISSEVSSIMNCSFSNQGVDVLTQSAEIIPDELTDLTFAFNGKQNVVVNDATANLAAIYHNSIPKSCDPSRIGPIIFGVLRLDVEYVDKEATDSEAELRIDSQFLNLVGYIIPAPLLSVSPLAVDFQAVYDHNNSCYDAMDEACGVFRLQNNSEDDVPFKIESLACRRPGLKLFLDSKMKSESSAAIPRITFDTIDVDVSHNVGTLGPKSFIDVSVRLAPGHTAGMDYCMREDGGVARDRSILAKIPITVCDNLHLHHPSSTACVLIKSDTMLDFIKTKPVTEIKRYKQAKEQADDEVVELREPSKEPANSNSFPNIRLRGLTFSAQTGRYDISMGQHTQRNESIEWLLKIENSSKQGVFEYEISTQSPGEDNAWITLGHFKGIVPPKSFSSVMLYFNRNNTGSFRTVLLVNNISSPQEPYLINTSFEVISLPPKDI